MARRRPLWRRKARHPQGWDDIAQWVNSQRNPREMLPRVWDLKVIEEAIRVNEKKI